MKDIFKVKVKMEGLKGIEVNEGMKGKGMKIGIKIIGRKLEEEKMFKEENVIEKDEGSLKKEKWW